MFSGPEPKAQGDSENCNADLDWKSPLSSLRVSCLPFVQPLPEHVRRPNR